MLQANAPLMSVGSQPIRQQDRQKQYGIWTMFGTWALLFTYAISTHGFADVAWILSHLYDVEAVRSHDSLMRMAPTIAATVVLVLPVIILFVMPIVRWRHRMKGEHANTNLFAAATPKEQFKIIMITLLGEEILARLIFLGFGTQIPGMDGFFGFIVLFVLGNGVWAVIHLGNMKSKEDRKYIMVLPQFAAGFFFTLIYLSYGIFGALMAHVIYDMILFAADRKDVWNLGEFLLMIYHLVGFGLAAYVFYGKGNQSLMDMKHWFDENGSGGFALPGWTFIDYLSVTIMLTAALTLLMELLLFDREGGESKEDVKADLTRIFFFNCACFVIVPFMEHFAPGNTNNALIKVFVIAIIGSFAIKSASGSGVARVFWESMLIAPVVIGCMLAMEDYMAPVLILVYVGYLTIDRVIRFKDTDELPASSKEEISAISGT
ncbi:CPBP family glutamic-type intramembrane protease [Shimazuella kribbensis]|uniref:CPBP family glutamic-type intramembrane protease n=1 Tax=Shimazuella kribbensis TaxID=139808 RepID=UPI0004071144|nr:CPBP family glutamic-type intramembrane protease [Shimazuella kribbensis]